MAFKIIQCQSVAVLARNIWGTQPHGERGAVARAYNRVWGRAPSGVQGQSPGQEAKPPWS